MKKIINYVGGVEIVLSALSSFPSKGRITICYCVSEKLSKHCIKNGEISIPEELLETKIKHVQNICEHIADCYIASKQNEESYQKLKKLGFI